MVTGDDAFLGRVFVSRVEVDYDSAPRYLALHLVRCKACCTADMTSELKLQDLMDCSCDMGLLPSWDATLRCTATGRLNRHRPHYCCLPC